jgi:hypothetical protein
VATVNRNPTASQAKQKKKPTPPKYAWLDAIVAADLKPLTKCLLWVISHHMYNNSKKCFPSQELLARETGMARQSVVAHIRDAQAKGWLKVSKLGLKGQAWKTNQYEIGYPEGCPAARQRTVQQLDNVREEGCLNDSKKIVQQLDTNPVKENPPPPPRTGNPDGGGGFSSGKSETQTPNPADSIIDDILSQWPEIFRENTGQHLGCPRRQDRARLRAIIERYGRQTLAEVFNGWCDPPEGFKDLKFKWAKFIDEWPVYAPPVLFKQARDEQKRKADGEAQSWQEAKA